MDNNEYKDCYETSMDSTVNRIDKALQERDNEFNYKINNITINMDNAFNRMDAKLNNTARWLKFYKYAILFEMIALIIGLVIIIKI